ncbi:phosphopantothenoylcysteine decarboxylase, partial [Hydrogenivirga sp. 128-5-R1-1]|uniref:phosphopantothenoylcysteine decarboxylase domain-containing protein n=1 Tax=Hydrogenivirga sp. 128-5-R1-1 TaxID=392423 RepID=UPI00015F05FD
KKENQLIIGFAAESSNLEKNAIDKLKRKNLDVIIVNKLEVFSKNYHEGSIIFKNGKKVKIPKLEKENSASYILENILKGE